MGFILRKWYLDVVSPEGEVCIAYWGVLQTGPISLHYSAFLHSAPGMPPTSRTSFSSCAGPTVTTNAVRWHNDALGLRVECEGDTSLAGRDLFSCEGGTVEWTPALPRAEVRVTTGGLSIVGRGCAESLVLTLPPWRLPIHTLHWGRWIGTAHTATWIRWEGPTPLRVVMIDGITHAHPTDITPDRIGAAGFALRLDRERTLRDGPIGDTLLSSFPGVRAWAPVEMLASVETKWLSRGELRGASGIVDHGWAIHEVVRFAHAPP